MKYYKLKFKTNKKDFVEDVELIDEYLACLYKNAQIVHYHSIFIKDDSVFCCVTLPEDKAMLKSYNNEYIDKLQEKIIQLFDVSFEEIGEDWNLDGKICECSSPSYYTLICDHSHSESPINCGDCGCSVPLYKLPKIFAENNYFTVREFERESKAIDDLWVSGYNDKLIIRQRNSPNSPLVKKGRKICEAFEKATGIRFYYHIPFDDDSTTECPFCGRNWKTKDKYKCDHCQLIATIETTS